MEVDGFGSSFGLVWIIGSSLLVSSLVLCGQQLLSSMEQQPLSSVEQQPLSSVGQSLSSVGHTTLCGYRFV
jgi:hypothetical protein